MKTTVTTHCKVAIAPRDLHRMDGVIRAYLAGLIGSCSREHGYVLGAEPVDHEASSTILHATGTVIASVRFRRTTFLPEVDEVSTAMVTNILVHGVFVLLHYIHVLIPEIYLLEDGWRSCDGSWERTGPTRLELNEWIQVRVILIRFENNQFQCIGRIAPTSSDHGQVAPTSQLETSL